MPSSKDPHRLDGLPAGTEVTLQGVIVGKDREGWTRVQIKGADGTVRNCSLPPSLSVTEHVAPAGPTCICGCGEPAHASRRFAMGHDAKLQSILRDQLRSGDPQAVDAAALELVLLGWIGRGGPSIWGVGRALLDLAGGADAFLEARALQRTRNEDHVQHALI